MSQSRPGTPARSIRPTARSGFRAAPARVALAFALSALAAAAGLAPAAAQLRPDAAYRVLESAHFRVTYGPGLDALAERALAAAESSHEFLVRSLSVPPRGRIDIVLSDDVDFSNGFANPFPSNRIVIYARPPVDDEALSYSPDWIELVVAHEIAHIFHLDRAGWLGRVMRSVFGRMSLLFPMFPAVSTPGWSTEGLAVVVESGFTGLGRARGSHHEMIVRTAVLEGEPDRMDRLNESSPIWPGDQRVYIYGSLFMDYLSDRYGEEVHRELLNRTAGAVLPPFLFFDNVARRTFGESFDRAYAAWRAELETRVARLADSLRAAGLTASERLTDHGRWALHPRLSRDGQRLAYSADDGRDVARTRVVDLATGSVSASRRRNGRGSLSWLPDGRLLVSQYEVHGLYRILFDLWVEGEAGRRLTTGERLQDPDVAGDGERVVAVQNGEGSARLALVRLSSGEVRPITAADPDVLWSFPRWSPDGTRIAAGRWHRGGVYDIVVVDTTGALLATLASDRALNLAPTWSPDGRHVLFSSDRTGITNLYAIDLTASGRPDLRQVTNVLTGAFQPEVSPDGRWIYFSAYHADGYAIERMRFDPAAWRDPMPVAPRAVAAEPAARADPATGSRGSSPDVPQARPYSPWRSLAPTSWQPVLLGADAAGTFLGAAVFGQDLVGRHSFAATVAADVGGSGRWDAFLRYTNSRLGNPSVSLEASRIWDDLGARQLPDSSIVDRIEREDAVAALITFEHLRWRHSAAFSVGIERETFTRRVLDRRVRFRDPEDRQWNLLARASFATTRTPAYAISREDGVLVRLAAKRSTESEATVYRDSTGVFPRDFTEIRGVAAAYRSLPVGGFAHHVLAVRGSFHSSDGPGAGLEGIGGSTGGSANILGIGITPGSKLLPVRGFGDAVLLGTRAWTATAEWRAPLALVGRRPGPSPVFIDRISAVAFADAGDAWCTASERTTSAACRNADLAATPILGAGAELVLDFGFAGIFRGRIRGGAGFPLRGPADGPRFYAELGSNF